MDDSPLLTRGGGISYPPMDMSELLLEGFKANMKEVIFAMGHNIYNLVYQRVLTYEAFPLEKIREIYSNYEQLILLKIGSNVDVPL